MHPPLALEWLGWNLNARGERICAEKAIPGFRDYLAAARGSFVVRSHTASRDRSDRPRRGWREMSCQEVSSRRWPGCPATHLDLIAQEAVHNAVKHAQAREVRVSPPGRRSTWAWACASCATGPRSSAPGWPSSRSSPAAPAWLAFWRGRSKAGVVVLR